MQIMIEIAVPKDQEHQLEHLAGIAASELGLIAPQPVGAPSRALYAHLVDPTAAPELILQLAFDDVKLALTGDDTKQLEEKIEGGRAKRGKRCRARVLVAKHEQAA